MNPTPTGLARARAVADAVLYEGYLLYPYRASSEKNRARFQFGVLGPPGAAEHGHGEAATMGMRCLLGDLPPAGGSVVVHVRFLQLQRRQLYDGRGEPVPQLPVGARTELSWDEATEQELVVPVGLAGLDDGFRAALRVDGGEVREPVLLADGTRAGTVVRRRWPLSGELTVRTARHGGHGEHAVLEVRVRNNHHGAVPDKETAQRRSWIGTHLILEADGCSFVSLVDPPPEVAALAAGCTQDRCWPFLAGDPGETDLLLGSPIILYDHPELAPESGGALFDATEIDEILTLRVMTMTDAEKAEARATDPRARTIIDRCDAMSAEDLQRLHGVFRDPHGAPAESLGEPPTVGEPDRPWWDPAVDGAADPAHDSVRVDGVEVRQGSLVRVHPNRRADAQDLFFADQVARVTAVVTDVDGSTHVAVVLADDPAADLHDWYGRYLYFAPDEVEPLDPDVAADRTDEPVPREESRP